MNLAGIRKEIKNLTSQIFPEIVSIRKWLHKNPELSFNEKKTSNYICSVLKKNKIQYVDNVGGYGVIAIINGLNNSKLQLFCCFITININPSTWLGASWFKVNCLFICLVNSIFPYLLYLCLNDIALDWIDIWKWILPNLLCWPTNINNMHLYRLVSMIRYIWSYNCTYLRTTNKYNSWVVCDNII